jgi:hypothetical protein
MVVTDSGKLKIETGLPVITKKGRILGSGKTKEYCLGKMIYDSLEIGQSTLLEEGIKRPSIIVRLNRLNIQNGTKLEFVTTSEKSRIRVHRIN